MMLRINFASCLIFVLISGCTDGISFTPYDYKRTENAKVKVRHFPYDVHIRGKEFFLKKELEVQK